MSYRNFTTVLGAGLASVLLAGCASGGGEGAAADTPAPAVNDVQLLADGRDVFQGAGRCFVCHGNGGTGGRFGPDLTDDEWVWLDPSDSSAAADMQALIRSGIADPRVSDTGMPPMGGGNLSDAQLNAVTAYILSL